MFDLERRERRGLALVGTGSKEQCCEAFHWILYGFSVFFALTAFACFGETGDTSARPAFYHSQCQLRLRTV